MITETIYIPVDPHTYECYTFETAVTNVFAKSYPKYFVRNMSEHLIL